MSNVVPIRRTGALDDYERGALDALVAWEASRAGRVRRWRRSLAGVLHDLAERVAP